MLVTQNDFKTPSTANNLAIKEKKRRRKQSHCTIKKKKEKENVCENKQS